MIASAVFLASALTALSAPIALENGALEIQVQPETFAIVSFRALTEANFVMPLPVSGDAAQAAEWLDPGGLVTDVLPSGEQDAALRRGPAAVVEREEGRLVLEGPVAAVSGLRLRKEIILGPRGDPSARFRVTVFATRSEAQRVYVRNTVRLPGRSTLRVARRDGTIRPLAGAESIYPAVVKSLDYWLIPVPPTAAMKGVVLGALSSGLHETRGRAVWVRRVALPLADASAYDHGVNVLCLLDTPSGTFGAALQGCWAEVSVSCPLVFEEEWRVASRARLDGGERP